MKIPHAKHHPIVAKNDFTLSHVVSHIFCAKLYEI